MKDYINVSNGIWVKKTEIKGVRIQNSKENMFELYVLMPRICRCEPGQRTISSDIQSYEWGRFTTETYTSYSLAVIAVEYFLENKFIDNETAIAIEKYREISRDISPIERNALEKFMFGYNVCNSYKFKEPTDDAVKALHDYLDDSAEGLVKIWRGLSDKVNSTLNSIKTETDK